MTAPSCRDCAYWSYDMDMDPFCVHPNASIMGTNLAAMRSTRELEHTRGPNCGPDGQLFEPRSLRNDAQNAAIDEAVAAVGSEWLHIKSGHSYRIIGACRLEHSNAPAYLYVGEDGTVWARDMDEFLDGRFARKP